MRFLALCLAFTVGIPATVIAPEAERIVVRSILDLGRNLSPYEEMFKMVAGDLWIERSAQAWAESGYNPFAKSYVGAAGLTQFMPKTWERWKPHPTAIPSDPFASICAQHSYMSYLLRMFGGDRVKARAAYNCGEGNVKRAMRKAKELGMNDSRGWLRALPFVTGEHATETQNYVTRIEKRIQWITTYAEGGPWTGPKGGT